MVALKAALFYGGPDIRVEERPVPEPGPGEVLVRVRAAGICGSDLHGYRGAWRRPRPADPQREDLESGHELAGEVAALGPGVQGLTVGQRVGVEPEHLAACGRCEWCRRGDGHLCPLRGRPHGRSHHSHGFSQYDVCAAAHVHPLPESVADEAAAILDCYACAVHAVRRAALTPHADVLVLGTGAIGMTVGQVARASGARRVVLAGLRPEPLRVARAAGAADETVCGDETAVSEGVRALTAGRGADVVFETVGGTAPTLRQAIDAATRGGTVCVLGIFTEAAPPLDVRAAYAKELTLAWSNSYSTWRGVSEYEIALQMLAAGRLRAEPLITHRFPLDRIGEAFAAAADKAASGAVKVIVRP